MKTLIRSIPSSSQPAGLLFFGILAFAPAILHLLSANIALTNPAVLLGPVIAGFGFAAGLRDIRVHSIVLGPVLGALLWAANWLMFAGGCCSTING